MPPQHLKVDRQTGEPDERCNPHQGLPAETASNPKIETRITHQHTDLMVRWCIGGCLGSTMGATPFSRAGEPKRRIGEARAVSYRMVKGWLMRFRPDLSMRRFSGT